MRAMCCLSFETQFVDCALNWLAFFWMAHAPSVAKAVKKN